MHDKALHKLNEFSKTNKLIILTKNEIEPYLKYAKSVYGDDFVKHYNKPI